VTIPDGKMKIVLAYAMKACGRSKCMPHLTPNVGNRWSRVSTARISRFVCMKGAGKAISLQTWTEPDGSRSFRRPDFKTIGT